MTKKYYTSEGTNYKQRSPNKLRGNMQTTKNNSL